METEVKVTWGLKPRSLGNPRSLTRQGHGLPLGLRKERGPATHLGLRPRSPRVRNPCVSLLVCWRLMKGGPAGAGPGEAGQGWGRRGSPDNPGPWASHSLPQPAFSPVMGTMTRAAARTRGRECHRHFRLLVAGRAKDQVPLAGA